MADLEFLSGDWLAALGEAVAGSLRAEIATSIALGQVVTGVASAGVASAGVEPAGVEPATAREVRYTLLLGPGSNVEVVTGSTEGADVILTTTYAAARALACGESSASSLLEQGRVKISGDARRLVEAADVLGLVGDALSNLRDRTTFRPEATDSHAGVV
jgi:hypothetical protein